MAITFWKDPWPSKDNVNWICSPGVKEKNSADLARLRHWTKHLTAKFVSLTASLPDMKQRPFPSELLDKEGTIIWRTRKDDGSAPERRICGGWLISVQPRPCPTFWSATPKVFCQWCTTLTRFLSTSNRPYCCGGESLSCLWRQFMKPSISPRRAASRRWNEIGQISIFLKMYYSYRWLRGHVACDDLNTLEQNE